MRVLSPAARVASCLATFLLAACSTNDAVPPVQGDDSGAPPRDAAAPDAPGPDGSADARTPDAMGDAAPDTGTDSGSQDSGSDAAAPTLLAGSIFGFSTLPPGGPAEQNPYGAVVVPAGFPTGGTLQPGDILVTNFNSAANVQGAGTTIVRITPNGARSTFFTSQLAGLSGALGVLQSGLVVVGNVPNTGGGAVGAGALQILDGSGALLQTISDGTLLLDPWGLAIHDSGATAQLFVSNVVSGTVARLDVTVSATALTVNQKVQIASGYATRTDPNAFVIGPGGMTYDPATDMLYLAAADERVGTVEAGSIFAVPQASTRSTDAGKGQTLFASATYMHGPFGLVRAPNGNLLVANTDAVNTDPMQPSEVVEITTTGTFVRQFPVDPNNGGAFGLAAGTVNGQPVFAAVNDNQLSLTVWQTAQPYERTLAVSTQPPGGPAEQNPYGLAVVPAGFPTAGVLQPGDVLVSNFNDANNDQGTGTTIVRVAASGARSTFFTSARLGLSGALGILKAGLVIAGNVPNTGGGAVGAGALQVLDASGNLVQTLTDAALLEDPWGLAVRDNGATAQLFVSNVISGTVTRLDVTASATALMVTNKIQIASGYATRTDPNAFVIGPGGMAYDTVSGTLYLASAGEKIGGVESGSVFAIAGAATATGDAGKGTVVFADVAHLHGPFGLVLAPNGNLILANTDAVNADPNRPSELVEISTAGTFVRESPVDPSNGGAFGLTIGTVNGEAVLGTVDDDQTTACLRSLP